MKKSKPRRSYDENPRAKTMLVYRRRGQLTFGNRGDGTGTAFEFKERTQTRRREVAEARKLCSGAEFRLIVVPFER